MKRTSPHTAFAALLVLSFACLAQEFRPIRPGVEHMKLTRATKTAGGADEPLVINLLKIDLSKVEIRIVHALDEAIGLETVSSMAARHGAMAGVNAGFFVTSGTLRGDNVGALVSNGTLLSEPTNNRAAVGFMKQGEKTEMIFGHLKFAGTLETARGGRRMVQGVNRARGEDELIIYTPEFHRTSLTTAVGLEVLVRRGRVAAVRDRSGSNHIPFDGYVISATGKAREWAVKNLAVGARVRLRTELIPEEAGAAAGWKQAYSVVAGGPQLVRDSRREISAEREGIRPNFVTDRHPRTAVARLKDGSMLLAVVDGRQAGYSVGISLVEFADLLMEYGAVAAINLDGGGSTAMVLESKLVNKPSDATGERAVSDAILIFSKKVSERGRR